jgi:D-alanyl-lipoteichoic acid acyltransferase DltB (MBOAT superfamily)
MIFSSIQYFLFLPIVVFLYWRTKGLTRLCLVVAASYFFYMSWLPIYGLFLLAMSLANWSLGILIAWANKKHATRPLAKPLLWIGLALNLGSLCYYKYTDFILQSLSQVFNFIATPLSHMTGMMPADLTIPDAPLLNLVLPLGISFFVFEFVHYLIDVYRGSQPIRSWLEFAAFAAFFPSQIAGPIKRFQDFVLKLRAPLPWSSALFDEAMSLFMQGLFKKVVLADTLGSITFFGFAANHTLSFGDAVICAVGFVVQVYCDFSGYTDMGRGSALLMGIRLPENFALPYLAPDLSEFWRRWHMSLSYWLRDYVYIPLGGSRVGRFTNWRNLMAVMVACGVWHGSAWHYVIFGILQGVGLIINREWKIFLSSFKSLEAAANTVFAKQIGVVVTMAFITVCFVIFRAPDIPHAFNILNGFTNFAGECTLFEPIQKCGAIQFVLIYMAFWIFTELVKSKPALFNVIRDQAPNSVSVFKQPIRLASWTAALILMFAAKPIVAVPFVYFQF